VPHRQRAAETNDDEKGPRHHSSRKAQQRPTKSELGTIRAAQPRSPPACRRGCGGSTTPPPLQRKATTGRVAAVPHRAATVVGVHHKAVAVVAAHISQAGGTMPDGTVGRGSLRIPGPKLPDRDAG